MSLPAGAVLAQLRREALAGMPLSCEVHAVLSVVGESGRTEEQDQATVTLPCNLAPRTRRPSEDIIAGRVGTAEQWLVRLPLTPAYAADVDAIALSNVFRIDTRTFQVTDILGGRGFETARQVVTTEVT